MGNKDTAECAAIFSRGKQSWRMSGKRFNKPFIRNARTVAMVLNLNLTTLNVFYVTVRGL